MTASGQNVLQKNTALALRRFSAWWEGYAFDAAAEALDIEQTLRRTERPEREIPPMIWGCGREEPGDPAWTMRHARTLGLAARSRVIVFGAGSGAPLIDLKRGARFVATGFARGCAPVRGVDLKTYDAAMAHLDRRAADGAIVFFELHRDGDPGAFAHFAAEFLKPGAPAAFVDFALARSDQRLAAGFESPLAGAPRPAAEYVRILKNSGFLVGDVADETRLFLPLIAKGWAGWRRAYEAACKRSDAIARAEAVRYLRDYAALWADRFEALKSGALQVVCVTARKAG